MPLLHSHSIDLCSYVHKNTLLAAKGGCICTPLTPPKSATASSRDNEWTVVAKAKRRAQRGSRAGKSVAGKKPQWHSVQALQARPASHHEASQDTGCTSSQSSRSGGKALDTHARETVEGVRRVWGTLREELHLQNCTFNFAKVD